MCAETRTPQTGSDCDRCSSDSPPGAPGLPAAASMHREHFSGTGLVLQRGTPSQGWGNALVLSAQVMTPLMENTCSRAPGEAGGIAMALSVPSPASLWYFSLVAFCKGT